ncbi:MAG: alpha/beta hydrolase [Cyclobacteriaceae bacterium]|jgi:pimeloyl-ACP methyl ester carboxylesterase|nr:alpha/beta hydrolase [Cyclobacteriaceae bacterium]
MRTQTRKVLKWLLVPIVIFCSALVMDSCLQFRMSTAEINTYFKDKQNKATLKQYEIGKRTLNYLITENNNKPLVIFVHGSPGSLSAFIDFMADTVLLNKAQLISVDRPGFGASDFGYAVPSLDEQAKLLKPVLEVNKKNRPVILVGHSLGGPLIAKMAIDYPELVDGLIFVAASVDPDLEPNETWFRAPLATPFLKWILPRSFRASNDEIYKLKPELEQLVPEWSEIKVPAIVIQGTKDSFVPAANADFAKRMLIHSSVQVQIIEGVDHFIPWNHPEIIRNAVLDLLKNEQLATNR